MTGLSEKAFFPGEQIGSAGGVDGTSDGIGSPHSFAPIVSSEWLEKVERMTLENLRLALEVERRFDMVPSAGFPHGYFEKGGSRG